MSFFATYFSDIARCVSRVVEQDLTHAADAICEAKKRGGKIILAGNGGSAAMASHVAVDLVKVAGIRAINFNETDMITCFANDFGYEQWISKALEYYADAADLVILISSSGQSLNILNAAKKSREIGIPVITFSGFKENNPLRTMGSLNFWVDSQNYNVVEMTHHIWLVAISDNIAVRK